VIAMLSALRSRIVDRRDDNGYSIVELLVAMGIFAVVLSIAAAGMIGMTRNTRKVANTNDAARQLDRSIKLMGQQAPFAQDISTEWSSGSDWYVSYDISDKNGTLRCYQWRLIATTDQLQYATWVASSTTAKSWRTMSTGVTNNPTSEKPFVVTLPTGGTKYQLSVDLIGTRGGNPTGKSEVQVVYVGANTTVNSATNICQ
jgi:prepilin-type N-terminal cleavage/methylation domain-containing protein